MKTVADKLRIRPGTALWASDPERISLIGVLPDTAMMVPTIAQATVALLIADGAQQARALLTDNQPWLDRPKALWLLYPKGNRSDVNRDSLWQLAASTACGRYHRWRWIRHGPRFASGH